MAQPNKAAIAKLKKNVMILDGNIAEITLFIEQKDLSEIEYEFEPVTVAFARFIRFVFRKYTRKNPTTSAIPAYRPISKKARQVEAVLNEFGGTLKEAEREGATIHAKLNTLMRDAHKLADRFQEYSHKW